MHLDLSLELPGAPRCTQCSLWRSKVYPTYHYHSQGTPVPVIRDLSYPEGQPECPPRVWYSPEIDPSKFTLHILSDTPGVFEWLKYILLMRWITVKGPNSYKSNIHVGLVVLICQASSHTWGTSYIFRARVLVWVAPSFCITCPCCICTWRCLWTSSIVVWTWLVSKIWSS